MVYAESAKKEQTILDLSRDLMGGGAVLKAMLVESFNRGTEVESKDVGGLVVPNVLDEIIANLEEALMLNRDAHKYLSSEVINKLHSK